MVHFFIHFELPELWPFLKSFKTANIQDVFLIFFVVYSFQTIEAKSAFQRETPPPKETHNDVFIQPPPRIPKPRGVVPLNFLQII